MPYDMWSTSNKAWQPQRVSVDLFGSSRQGHQQLAPSGQGGQTENLCHDATTQWNTRHGLYKQYKPSKLEVYDWVYHFNPLYLNQALGKGRVSMLNRQMGFFHVRTVFSAIRNIIAVQLFLKPDKRVASSSRHAFSEIWQLGISACSEISCAAATPWGSSAWYHGTGSGKMWKAVAGQITLQLPYCGFSNETYTQKWVCPKVAYPCIPLLIRYSGIPHVQKP